ncbi:hypothetical protein PIB30_081664 [Stylosanthes scabra]|uniref:Uncharacterized protein n=1 Tax=Stylosanthes scabra TaxID=79078 RepID=A0ABU6UUF0_9FABA|nr:hypothetical protein [Stylosanthes scabra]
MAVESATQQLRLNELFKPAVTKPNALIPVVTVVNLCRRDLTLASRGIRIAVTNLTSFLPIRSYGGLAAKMLKPTDAYACKLPMRTHLCRIRLLGVPPTSRCVHMASFVAYAFGPVIGGF